MIEKINKALDNLVECFLYAFTYVTFANFFGWVWHTVGVITTSLLCFIVVHEFKKWYAKKFD
jgi:hypothetical protein